MNMFWEYQTIQLPSLPQGRRWRVVMNTEFKHSEDTNYHMLTSWHGMDRIQMCPRSVLIAVVDKY
jgi:glycogen operon protein